MNMKKFYVTSTGILLLVSAVLLLGQSLVLAETCQIVRITTEKGGAGTRLEINPQKIIVPTDTCVVWVNWVARDSVRVSFRENVKQCILSTDSPSGFKFDILAPGEECYFTEFLPRGKSASMHFKKAGVFKYTLEIPDPKSKGGTLGGYPGTIVAEGIIEVK